MFSVSEFAKSEEIRKAVELIIENGKQFEAIDALMKSLQSEMQRADVDRIEYKAALQAIRKINRSNNEAIDALCETR